LDRDVRSDWREQACGRSTEDGLEQPRAPELPLAERSFGKGGRSN
jgi:hypothetical protein